MGNWIKKVDSIHVHDYPMYVPSNVFPGSVWECSCGSRFVLDEDYVWEQEFESYTENSMDDILPDFMKKWARDIHDR